MLKILKHRFKSIGYFLWSIFLKGLLTLLPITLTVAVLNLSFKILKNWLRPIYNLEPDFLKAIPFSEFLLTFFFVLLIGLILNVFILNSFWAAFETLIGKIPLVRPIYAGIKQLVQAFNPHDNGSFKHVVLIEFPRQGIYSIGFMTSEAPTELSPDTRTIYYNVFIPTTPNPTAGFFLIIPKENVQITNLSRQEAMALIISGGIIQPERFTVNTK
jgi:uncharacterized membrane protein